MRSLIHPVTTAHTPHSLVAALAGPEGGVVLLRSGLPETAQSRYSMVAARPFLNFRSSGSRCVVSHGGHTEVRFGDPWRLLDRLIACYEILDHVDLPFPLGGCFGYWGFDLKNFVEPKLPRRAPNDLEVPDCHVGFYGSLVVFDHALGKTWIVATGLDASGARSDRTASEQQAFWQEALEAVKESHRSEHVAGLGRVETQPISNLSGAEFIECVGRAKDYIRAGDIYQVNLSHRLSTPFASGWELFERLSAVSPAPFSAYLDCGDFEIASSSPELFMNFSGSQVRTRPIKGTRPRSKDPARDTQLSDELRTSAKEMAELVMITDLLRNDLGMVCEFGSIGVPELVRLERYAHVQHLVSTVEGRLRAEVTHCDALASCFPGGSVTGAPKFRALEIIDELEPVSRGPYTGALGYLGFNRESQLSIIIRSALCKDGIAHFNVGAGIVADSDPAAEYEETLAKAKGFFEALATVPPHDRLSQRTTPSRSRSQSLRI